MSLSIATVFHLVFLGLTAAHPSLRGSPEELKGQANASLRRTEGSDVAFVNPVCVDYTIEGYFPARGAPLSEALPSPVGEQTFINRPPTLSVCELEQLHHDCIDRINMYRSGELRFSDGSVDDDVDANPRNPLVMNAGGNQCSSHQAMGDLNFMLQSPGMGCHHTSGTCPFGGPRGQNSCCLRGDSIWTYDLVKENLFNCLQGMWDEAMGPNGVDEGNHHAGMKNIAYQYASCGFAWTDDGKIVMTQDFTGTEPASDTACSCEGKSAGDNDGCGGTCIACTEAQQAPCTDNAHTGVSSPSCSGEAVGDTRMCTCIDHQTKSFLRGCEVARVAEACPQTCGTCPNAVATCPPAPTTTTSTTTTTVALPVEQVDIIEGESCKGNDCFSVARCPTGSSIIDCRSEGETSGDGIQLSSTQCVARGSGRRRRKAKSIAALAACSSLASTSVVVSSTQYLDRQVVSASCSSGQPMSCYCHSAWSDCHETQFSPVGATCQHEIGASNANGRRRRSGVGARVYALCEAPTTSYETIWGTECSGNDCWSVASCGAGASVIKCASLPSNAADGLQISSTECKARGSGDGSSVRAVAVCSTTRTTAVTMSSSMYLDSQDVSATCSHSRALSCYCDSAWIGVCGSLSFSPSGSTCTKSVGASSGRRRGVGSGAGARIYALCEGPGEL